MGKQKNLKSTDYEDLIDHFSKNDLKIFEILEKVGPVEFDLIENPFQALVESILSQQVSTKSADSTIQKVKDFRGGFDQPEEWIGISTEKWREYGVSRQKSSYLDSLANFFIENRKQLHNLDKMKDDEIVELLVQVKGIGEWTAHMFLIFCLGRENVLAPGDLGIRYMAQRVYELNDLATREELEEISKPWHPYISWAQIYLWRYSRI